jgi:hypothetical protein
LSNGVANLFKSFTGITNDDFRIINVNTTDSYSSNIESDRIKVDFGDNPTYNYVAIEYAVATYKLDRGYQQIGTSMNDAIRKLSKFHSAHQIYDYNTSSNIHLFPVPDDPIDPLQSLSPHIIIPLSSENTSRITFDYLALTYNTKLTGTFSIDDCVALRCLNILSPSILAPGIKILILKLICSQFLP